MPDPEPQLVSCGGSCRAVHHVSPPTARPRGPVIRQAVSLHSQSTGRAMSRLDEAAPADWWPRAHALTGDGAGRSCAIPLDSTPPAVGLHEARHTAFTVAGAPAQVANACIRPTTPCLAAT